MSAGCAALLAIGVVSLAPHVGAAANVPLKDWEAPIGVPTGPASPQFPLWIRVWERTGDGTQASPYRSTPRDLVITNIAPYNPQVETISQASERKANAIRDRANAVLGNGRATVTPYQVTINNQQITLYQVNMSNVHHHVIARNFTGETGRDGSRYREGTPPSGSYPYQGSMGGNSQSMSATGVDYLGDPSVVEFGVEGIYIATLSIGSGMTDEDILLALEADLDANNLPATYNSLTRTLSLDDPTFDDDTFVWLFTDSGFSMQVAHGYYVPEPSALALLSAGGFLTGWALRRRRRRRL